MQAPPPRHAHLGGHLSCQALAHHRESMGLTVKPDIAGERLDVLHEGSACPQGLAQGVITLIDTRQPVWNRKAKRVRVRKQAARSWVPCPYVCAT